MISASLPCWVVHDGAAGNRRQAVALAEMLGLSFTEWALTVQRPWRWFAPRKVLGSGSAFGAEFSKALNDTPPAVVIGCGRQAALATRLARERGAKAVQILDPRIATRHWDLVIAPEHDNLHGENVIPMLGSLHPVTANWLTRARIEFPALGQLPSPRTAVLLGGPTRATRFDHEAFATLAAKLDTWLANEGGSVLLCGSRRTPTTLIDAVRERYGQHSGIVWMQERDGVNPYPGVLAWADRIIVSPDSVNMISEACATAVPVFVSEPDRATGRVRKFIAQLQLLERIREQEYQPRYFSVTPIREASRIAALVQERFKLVHTQSVR